MTWFRTAGLVIGALLLGFFVSSLFSGCRDAPRRDAEDTVDLANEDLLATNPDSPVPASSASPEKGDPQNKTLKPDAPTSSGVIKQVNDAAATADAKTVDKKSTAETAMDKSANANLEPGDWPQFGGSSYRNNSSPAKGIPVEWIVGGFDRRTNAWISDEAENVKWVARLGSQTYMGPAIAGGRVFVGTNNGAGYLARYPSKIDLGCLLCFDESDGSLLWQASSEKLPTGSVHDWPQQGICCVPLVENNRLWYVTSRGEVVCLDTEGFHDSEDDGPVQNEQGRLLSILKSDDPDVDPVAPMVADLDAGKVSTVLSERLTAAGAELPASPELSTVKANSQWSLQVKINGVDRPCEIKLEEEMLTVDAPIQIDDKQEADTVWKYDMMGQLGVSQHNMCSCSVTAIGDVLFVNTSNGVDESEEEVAAPDAPSFIALDKATGELIWKDNSPGANIFHGQWSSPAAGVIHGVPQVIFGAGDGWVFSFQADRGENGKPILLWKFDTNPKESEWIDGGGGDRTNIIATPVIHDGLVYVVGGHDPEFGVGKTRLWCIDASKRGDVSPQLAVMADDHSKIVPPRRVQAVITQQGETAIDNPNSAAVWVYSGVDKNEDGQFDFEEEMHCSCGGVAVKDDLLFIADFAGLVHCLDAKSGVLHWNYDTMGNVWSGPLIVEDHVYVGNEDGMVIIFELTKEGHDPLYEQDMEDSVYSSPTVANGVLFVATRSHLVAIQAKAE